MNFSLDALAEWLKTSLLGIIILGAFGSLLAVWLTKVAQKIFLDVIPRRWRAAIQQKIKESYTAGFVIGFLLGSKDIGAMLIFYAYRITVMIFFLFCALLFALLFMFLILLQPSRLLTFGSYCALVVSMLSLYRALREAKYFRFNYKATIKPILEKAEEAYVERGNKVKEEVSDTFVKR